MAVVLATKLGAANVVSSEPAVAFDARTATTTATAAAVIAVANAAAPTAAAAATAVATSAWGTVACTSHRCTAQQGICCGTAEQQS